MLLVVGNCGLLVRRDVGAMAVVARCDGGVGVARRGTGEIPNFVDVFAGSDECGYGSEDSALISGFVFARCI